MKPDWRIGSPIFTTGFTGERIGHNLQGGSIYRRPTDGNVRWASPRSVQTALERSSHLGWAEIRHPFHPLRGQRFEVLKQRRIAGVDTLIVREPEFGSISIAREWTDWADPSEYDGLSRPPRRFDAEPLFQLVTLVELLTRRGEKC